MFSSLPFWLRVALLSVQRQILCRRQDQHTGYCLAVIGAKMLNVTSHQVSCLRIDGRLENRLIFIGKVYGGR